MLPFGEGAAGDGMLAGHVMAEQFGRTKVVACGQSVFGAGVFDAGPIAFTELLQCAAYRKCATAVAQAKAIARFMRVDGAGFGAAATQHRRVRAKGWPPEANRAVNRHNRRKILKYPPVAMLFVLSPAKSLDYETPIAPVAHSAPLFPAESAELVAILREQAPQQMAALMGISDKLAALNVARFAAWSKKATPANARQAVLAFNGDVYDGLDARTLTAAQLDWTQQHLCILSGLYGVLRPLDLMQPYRLEMGTALPNARGDNLYRFWGGTIAQYLNTRLQEQNGEPVLVNLASQEYFKSIDRSVLKARVVECVFEDFKDGTYKIISFFAKRARGLMMRHAIENRVGSVGGLTAFASAGYAWAPEASGPDRLVFRRKNRE